MTRDRWISGLLFAFGVYFLLLALASHSARAPIPTIVLGLGSYGMWTLGRRWTAVAARPPARTLVAVTLTFGALLALVGGYCSIESANNIGPSLTELELGINSLAVYLGIGVAALGMLLVIIVITAAHARRSPSPGVSAPPSPPT